MNDNNLVLTFESLPLINDVDLQAGNGCRYACCGNCRYFDGDDWCGYNRCRTTGGDHCDNWREE